jgi:hypothetical protein
LLDHRDRKLASAASGRVFVPYPLGREPLLLPLEFLLARKQRDDRVRLLDARLDLLRQTLAAENFAGDKHQSVAANNPIDIPNQVIVLGRKENARKILFTWRLEQLVSDQRQYRTVDRPQCYLCARR